MNSKSRKLFAAALALAITLAILLAFSVGIIFSLHACTGEDCEICRHYICLRKIIDGIIKGLFAFICFFGILSSSAGTLFSKNDNVARVTPVKLFVKLSD